MRRPVKASRVYKFEPKRDFQIGAAALGHVNWNFRWFGVNRAAVERKLR